MVFNTTYKGEAIEDALIFKITGGILARPLWTFVNNILVFSTFFPLVSSTRVGYETTIMRLHYFWGEAVAYYTMQECLEHFDFLFGKNHSKPIYNITILIYWLKESVHSMELKKTFSLSKSAFLQFNSLSIHIDIKIKSVKIQNWIQVAP